MKNRSERNSGFKSVAQILFEKKELLISRPEGVPFEDYKFLQRTQDLILRNIFSGRCPDKCLPGIMGVSRNFGVVKKGITRRVTQRKAS